MKAKKNTNSAKLRNQEIHYLNLTPKWLYFIAQLQQSRKEMNYQQISYTVVAPDSWPHIKCRQSLAANKLRQMNLHFLAIFRPYFPPQTAHALSLCPHSHTKIK